MGGGGIFPKSFFVAVWRILENISFRPLPMLFDFFFPGYSDTMIICLGYRQRVQYVCVPMSQV